MAIQKKLLHFKKFSDFNSKKLSANENNTQYTLGVDGAVTDGSPDVLYQSICWIKDTQQQWTHGRLYDCSGVKDVYVLDFSISDLYVLMHHNTPVAVDANALEAAIRSNKVILISEEPNDVGVCGKFLVTAVIEDMIYLQIAHLDTPSYYDVGIDLGATTVSYAEERYIQNKLVSGSNIKTINGESILGRGDLQIGVYVTDFSRINLEDLYRGKISEVPVNAAALAQAIKDNKVIAIPEIIDDEFAYGNYIAQATVDDVIYLTLPQGNARYWIYINLKATSFTRVEKDIIQNELVSEVNIKTINGSPILGSGDLQIYANEVLLQDGRDIELALDILDKKIDISITTALNTEV